MRQDYRRITAGFSREPSPERFRIQGVLQMHANGRQVSLLATEKADTLWNSCEAWSPVSVEVAPMSLREVFLETVREDV